MGDGQGAVTLTRSFTPWGELLAQEGNVDFTWGYLGGVLDSATGLVYVGNGQYYDPATGRFLSRGVNPTAPNPYVPWQGNPLGMIVGPLALLAMVRSRRKAGKVDQFLVILVVLIATGVVASGCGIPITPNPAGATPTTPPTTGTPNPTIPGNGSGSGGGATQPPTQNPTTPTPCSPTPGTPPTTGTPPITPTPVLWKPIGAYNLSAYYVTHESQYYSGAGSNSGPIPSLDNISANKYFLFRQGDVCTQGTGKLKDGRYIGCIENISWDHKEEPVPNGGWLNNMPPENAENREKIPFFWSGARVPPQFEAFETAAVCETGVIPRDINRSVEIRINDPVLIQIMGGKGKDNVFYVTDVGGGLCATNGIDIFLGEQPSYSKDPQNSFWKDTALPIINIDSAEVEIMDKR